MYDFVFIFPLRDTTPVDQSAHLYSCSSASARISWLGKPVKASSIWPMPRLFFCFLPWPKLVVPIYGQHCRDFVHGSRKSR